MSEQPEVRNLRDLNAHVKAIVERETISDPIWINGIVKNVEFKPSRYLHFTLDDGGYEIECTLSERVHTKLGFSIKAGMEINLCGAVRVWDKRAQLQFQVEKVELVQNAPSNNVLERLSKEGLYPKQRKSLHRPINRIAVITSQNSRALKDFYAYYKQQVNVLDVPVEGQFASQRISDTINQVNHDKNADVIVLIRGGGELDSFNDYLVAEAICLSSIPVVTGIGHHGSETIADIVADFSFGTPTAVGIELAKLSTSGTGENRVDVGANQRVRPNSLENPPTPTSQPSATPQIVNPAPPKKSSWQNVILLVIGFMIALAALIFAIGQLN